MTVESGEFRSDYTGNGSVKTYAVGFQALEDSDLLVLLTDPNDLDNPVEQTLDSDYSVTGDLSQGTASVVFTTAPATGFLVAILREMPLTQGTNYEQYDDFPAESHERALDKLTMIAQELSEKFSRAPAMPRSIESEGLQFPAPAAGQTIAWDDPATKLVNGPTGTEVANAQGYASAASASALAASGDAGDAETSRIAAENARDAAIAARDAIPAAADILVTDDIGDTVEAHDPDTLKADTPDLLQAVYGDEACGNVGVNIAPDPTFEQDGTAGGWVLAADGSVYPSGGVLDTGMSSVLYAGVQLTLPADPSEGDKYLLRVVVDSMSTGTLVVAIRPSDDVEFSENGPYITSAGTYTQIIESDETSTTLRVIKNTTDCDAVVSSVHLHPIGLGTDIAPDPLFELGQQSTWFVSAGSSVTFNVGSVVINNDTSNMGYAQLNASKTYYVDVDIDLVGGSGRFITNGTFANGTGQQPLVDGRNLAAVKGATYIQIDPYTSGVTVNAFHIYDLDGIPGFDLSTLDVTRNHIQWALIGDSQFSDMALPYDGTYVVHVYPLGHTLGIATSYKSDGFLPDPDPNAGEIRITVEQYLGRKTIVSLQNMEV